MSVRFYLKKVILEVHLHSYLYQLHDSRSVENRVKELVIESFYKRSFSSNIGSLCEKRFHLSKVSVKLTAPPSRLARICGN